MSKPLHTYNYINLATFRKNGHSVQTPVWFAGEGDIFYIFTNKDAGKVKRVKNFQNVRVAPCTINGKILAEWTEGKAFILKSHEEIEIANQALVAKYGWQARCLNFFSRVSGKISQRVYIRLELNSVDTARADTT